MRLHAGRSEIQELPPDLFQKALLSAKELIKRDAEWDEIGTAANIVLLALERAERLQERDSITLETERAQMTRDQDAIKRQREDDPTSSLPFTTNLLSCSITVTLQRL